MWLELFYADYIMDGAKIFILFQFSQLLILTGFEVK